MTDATMTLTFDLDEVLRAADERGDRIVLDLTAAHALATELRQLRSERARMRAALETLRDELRQTRPADAFAELVHDAVHGALDD